MGNSTGMIVPKAMLDALGLTSGAKLELRLENGEVIARLVEQAPRQGWAEAAQAIAAEGLTADKRAWLSAPNEFDAAWEW